jgi:hypothetical protein
MNTKNIIIGLLVIIVVGLLARYVVFKEQFNEWGEGLERVGQWEEDYRSEHPNATDAEVDAAFKSGIADITVWKEQYKQEHPGATDADADAAFNAAWDNN